MIQSPDDLRARIRELGETEPDPARITAHILRSLTADECRVVAAAALHDFVRINVKNAGGPAQTYETANGVRMPSAKQAGIRDWVERELRRHVYTGNPDQPWKFLTDCTVDDLYAAVEIRRRKAEQTLAEADWFEGVAKAAEHAGVDTVGQLPRTLLAEVLRR
jgi:hypothetical protein